MCINREYISGKVIHNNKLYSNKEILELVDRIKSYILNNYNGITMVAVAMPKSVYLLSTILALLDCRITYLILDLEVQPKERIDYILEDSGVNTILSISTLNYDFKDKNVINIDNINKETKLNNYYMVNSDNELAYIIYTSGTTGYPKGVEIYRNSLVKFVNGITEIISFSKNDRIVSFTSPSFDIFFLEAILPLYLGMTVILSTVSESKNPQSMIALILNNNVNILQLTPSGLRLLNAVDKKFKFLKNVHTIMIGGEVFPGELLSELQSLKNIKIYNMYGPTETTIWSSVANLTYSNYVHLGEPINDTEIFLLDENMHSVACGEKGEICISGGGLARGYYNNRELTKQRFCKIQELHNKLVYKTGDIGFVNSTGDLIYVGRLDNQIKNKGHRIELEDIELNILQIEEVDSAVVCFEDDRKELITFYTSKKGDISKMIYSQLKIKLPEYMIPHKFILAKNFLYTSSGKIDRKNMLEKYYSNVVMNDNDDLKLNKEIKETILSIVSKHINIKTSEIDFFIPLSDIGFDSITYVEFIVELESKFNIEFQENVLVINYFKNLEELYMCVSELKN